MSVGAGLCGHAPVCADIFLGTCVCYGEEGQGESWWVAVAGFHSLVLIYGTLFLSSIIIIINIITLIITTNTY